MWDEAEWTVTGGGGAEAGSRVGSGQSDCTQEEAATGERGGSPTVTKRIHSPLDPSEINL